MVDDQFTTKKESLWAAEVMREIQGLSLDTTNPRGPWQREYKDPSQPWLGFTYPEQ